MMPPVVQTCFYMRSFFHAFLLLAPREGSTSMVLHEKLLHFFVLPAPREGRQVYQQVEGGALGVPHS